MKILLAGTPTFALATFKAIITHFDVVGIISQPDRKTGRKMVLTATPVSLLAKEHNIPLYQPEKIADLYETLQTLDFDLFITMAYGQIIPEKILHLAKKLALNVHASLLPKYRGAAPIQYALWKGEQITGITLMQMERKMDSGPILFQAQLAIAPEDNADRLHEKLSALAAGKIVDWLNLIAQDQFQLIPQNHQLATFAPKILPADEIIGWDTMSNTTNKIRALSTQPGAYFINPINNERIKVFAVTDEPVNNAVLIRCINGLLFATSYQVAGRKRVDLKVK